VSHPLLTGPIGPALWRLASPTTAFMVLQIFVILFDVWLVASLGLESLAAAAIVGPFIVFVMNVSSGAFGGAVASAIARALGAGRHDDARALVLHTLVVAAGFGALCTIFAWTLAPPLYRLIGGEGEVLRLARSLSDVWFSGVVFVWAVNMLSGALRGAGNAALPARIGLVGTGLYVPLSLVLTLGVGEIPGLGLVGTAIAGITSSTVVLVLELRALWNGRVGFSPSLGGRGLQRRLFAEIMGVASTGFMITLFGNASAIVMTGLVGRFGTAALAGYSIGSRLEHMLGALCYGIGTGAITLIGVAAGANAWTRAVRVAWVAGLCGTVVTGAIGGVIALMPETWARLFTSDPEVIAASVAYLTRVTPFYALFGLGLALHFAGQGAGRMTMPFLAMAARAAFALGGGWIAIEIMGYGLTSLFWASGISIVIYAAIMAGSLWLWPWRAKAPRERQRPSPDN
jgi:putative MATE family efflux protein